jgi:hypothetical protein
MTALEQPGKEQNQDGSCEPDRNQRPSPGQGMPARPAGATPTQTTARPASATPTQTTARPPSAMPTQTTARPASGQQRAHHVLGELLDTAATHNLPPIDWRLAAFEAHLTGRCTAYPGPARRRADFEAWTTLLGAHATEDTGDGQPVRLRARTQRDDGRVTIEITADLYDDLPTPLTTPAPSRNWRSP